ncbi:Utp14 protein-domain-containing protein [Irpex lacteus]|nr:Utp14 protein-domain-containing protein [Irpex lacteus]
MHSPAEVSLLLLGYGTFTVALQCQSQKRNSNAAGYAKRKSVKSKTLSSGGSSSLGDVYEYQGERVRRGKLKLQLEKDELLGAGRPVDDEDMDDDMDGEGGGGRGGMHPRLLNENEGDEEEGLGEDEDEEIDSDEAFEESDEERFAWSSFASAGARASKAKLKKTRAARDAKSVRFAEVDLITRFANGNNEDSDEDEASEGSEDSDAGEEEEEDEEEEGDPDEFINVLDILDGRGEPQSDEDVKGAETRGDGQNKIRTEEEDEAEEDEESEEEEDEDEDEDEEPCERALSPSDDEEDNDDPDALSHLESFITNLDANGVGGAERARRKTRLLREETQGGVEGEFAAQPGETAKLNLEDLLAPLTTTTTSSALQSLKKPVKPARSYHRWRTLAAPLPQRTQEGLDREAAYEQTKQEIDKWSATMRRIKEAEHLSFPLQAEVKGKVSSLELAAKFKPTTPLESGIDKLLKSAQMRDEDLAHTESLKMNHLSVEDVAQRRAELAKMRELMFRAEVKAKRVKKIKSKMFRRIRKKQRARAGEGSDEEDGEDEEGEEGVLKREVERARERAKLKHKNTGKWARAMKERGELDRGEKLRRRIQGRGSDDDSDEEEDGEGDEETITAGSFDDLRKDVDHRDGEEGERKKGKSVFEMKYMKDAMAREQRKPVQMVDDYVRELDGGEDGEERDADSPSELPDSLSHRVGGRVSFRSGSMTGQLRTVTSLASDTSSVTLKSTDLLSDGTYPSLATTSPIVSRAVPLPEEASNPWLAATADAEKSKDKLKKRGKKREEEKAKAKEDAVVGVEMASVMTLGTAAPAASGSSTSAGPSTTSSGPSKTPKKKGKKVASAAGEEDEESDGNSEVDAQEAALQSKAKGKAGRKDVQAFQQRDIVARAFAGDNVVREFADEKRREMDADAPKEIDTALAGWGSWGGAGTRKAPPKPELIKKVAGVDPKSRADYYGKRHVIISEKRDKKAAKYQVKDLPYPYTSKAQFERSMDTPLGTEWNTRVGFQMGTLPKVVKKMGTVISRKVVPGVTFAFFGLFTFSCIIYHCNMYFFIALSRPIHLLGMVLRFK